MKTKKSKTQHSIKSNVYNECCTWHKDNWIRIYSLAKGVFKKVLPEIKNLAEYK